ncbi:MAG: multicopper oxidase domain-containing protein [Anaerolineae bacterium]|nr:multicopper oxidase domain-containing protein [Anaerolineae bacterium]
MNSKLSRRDFLKLGGVALVGAAGVGSFNSQNASASPNKPLPQKPHSDDFGPGVVGEVDHKANRFNPTDLLSDFDYGVVSTLPNGQTLREYEILAANQNIEVVPGIEFPAWTYNGRIPGPTIRCTEGDRIRINFINGSDHPHSMHFHGVHPVEMDGVPGTGPGGSVAPGGSFVYEFDADPFGIHLYHCHVFPLARHVAKGLYGAFIVDPKGGRPPVDQEMIMVMHGFDIDFDNTNDFYAVNGIPFHYQINPIQIKVNETVRIYLVNILEFDLINSFHLHANFFNYYPTGTSLTPAEFTDTIMQTQAQRGIIEFSYKFPSMFMFHAHNTEFAELGWTGMFEVIP